MPTDLNDRRIQIGAGKNELNKLCEFHKIDVLDYNGKQSLIKIARNLVDYEAGKTILEVALNIFKSNNTNQKSLFDEKM